MSKQVKQKPLERGSSKPRQRETDRTSDGKSDKRSDGHFEIEISKDRMRAFISFSPSVGGGAPICLEKVKNTLAAMKIVFGINEELLKRLIDNVEKTKDEKKGVIIAQGLIPEEGKEGLVRYHFQDREEVPPRPEGRDSVPVAAAKAGKGELLATVVKPIPGKEGKDVLGNPVPAPNVRDPKLLAGPNIRVDKGSKYYMEVDGIVEVREGEDGALTISGRAQSDGEFTIRIPDGDMEVLADIRPSLGGGKPVDPAEVLGECTRQGVAVEVDVAKVRQAVFKAENERVAVEGVLIARGEPPVHGSDGTVTSPIRFATGSRLSRLPDGSVDYKEQDLFTPVEKGTVLAKLTEPGRAVRNGVTVKGKTVEAKKGRNATLVAGNNTLVEKRDGYSRYIAAIDGRLCFDSRSVSVEPAMLIAGDVGPKTGNVRFNGVIEVLGDVLDGYRVYGKKGLMIRGSVGNAEVYSERSVTVLSGVAGKGGGVVSAGGDVAVRFAENARIEAGGEIVVHRAAMNCSMLSGGRIVAVQDKGQIVGGELRARFGVVAKVLGNDSEHRMEIFAGSDFFVERTLQETRRQLERCASEMKALDGESHSMKAALIAETEDLKRVENECLLKLEEVFDAQVIAQETLYKGVRIHFGRSVYEPDGTNTRAKVVYDKEQRRIDVCRL